jgi:branched-chain amino acid transport system ATP-binding protein
MLFEAERLSKRFGSTRVLQDVSLTVQEGQIAGIIGPNGAGKTTCFNVLTGRFRPDTGRVRLAGKDITGASPREISRMGLARSFQVMNLFDQFSVLENVLVAIPRIRRHGFRWWSDAAADRESIGQARAALARVGLEAKADLPAKGLSYGERRALEVAVALASEPRLLFLDEPTAGLGLEGTARLAELVEKLRGRVTMVIIEHDMRFLFRLADHISVLHWGQVIARGTPEELRRNRWVQRSSLAAGT